MWLFIWLYSLSGSTLSSRNRSIHASLRYIMPYFAPVYQSPIYCTTDLPWQINSTLIIFLYLHLSLVFLLKRLVFQVFPTFEFSFLFKISSQIFSCFLMFCPTILVNPLVKQTSLPTGFLTICYPIYFFLCIIKIHMGVSVQGYTDVCVTHDIL